MGEESDSESSAALDFFDGNSIVGRDFVYDPGWRAMHTHYCRQIFSDPRIMSQRVPCLIVEVSVQDREDVVGMMRPAGTSS